MFRFTVSKGHLDCPKNTHRPDQIRFYRDVPKYITN